MRTTVGITSAFRHYIQSLRCSPEDFTVECSGELLELREAHSGKVRGNLIDYRETDFTMLERQRMRSINLWISRLDIGWAGEPASCPDLEKRKLRRVFNNGSFEHGGRLFGGVWMDLSKVDRARWLRLAGEPVATVDYRQMMPRLLYAQAGAVPPDDCYAVPGFEAHRAGWKKMLNAMMYNGRGLKRCPRGLRPLLPKRMPIAEAEQRLLEINKPISHLLKPGVGFQLMFHESQLLIDVLTVLQSRKIPALPIHDAVLVPASMTAEAAHVMCKAFEDMTGYSGAVSIEK